MFSKHARGWRGVPAHAFNKHWTFQIYIFIIQGLSYNIELLFPDVAFQIILIVAFQLYILPYQEFCRENPYYERSLSLDKAAGVSMHTLRMEASSSSRPSDTAKTAEPSKAPEVPRKENKALATKNQEAEKKNQELIKKEQEANKDVMELDSDAPSSKPVQMAPMVGKRLGVGLKQKQDQLKEAAAAKAAELRKGISIKLTGKTQMNTKPAASNPLQTLVKKDAKPIVVPQRAPAFMQAQVRKPAPKLSEAPPSLDNFLSVAKGSVPVFAMTPDVTDPAVLKKMSAAEREKIAEMKMLGILPERSSCQPVPRPPPMLPSAGKKPESKMAATEASKMYGVFFGSKEAGNGEPDKEGKNSLGLFAFCLF